MVLRGDGGCPGVFRDERLSPAPFTCGEHGVGVDESGISDVYGSLVKPDPI